MDISHITTMTMKSTATIMKVTPPNESVNHACVVRFRRERAIDPRTRSDPRGSADYIRITFV